MSERHVFFGKFCIEQKDGTDEYAVSSVPMTGKEIDMLVGIVRCRDCARSWVFDLSGLYNNHEHDQMYCALTVGHGRLVEPDGFCAWAQRKEDK